MSSSLVEIRARFQARWSQAVFDALPDGAREMLTRLDVGKLRIPGEDLRVFSEKQSGKRKASVLEQLAREREELAEFKTTLCSGTDHESTEDCATRLEALEPILVSLVPIVGPPDVYDFVYIVGAGEWEGRLGRWYHDYPICELLGEEPEWEDVQAFGAHVLDVSKREDERVL